MNMKQSCKALICAIEGELDGRHCTEEQAAAILDHALPSLTEALARVEAERDSLMDTYVALAEKLGIDLESARKAPGKPSDVFVAYIQAERDTAQAQLADVLYILDQHRAWTGMGWEQLPVPVHAVEKIRSKLAQAEQQEAQGAQAVDEREEFEAWFTEKSKTLPLLRGEGVLRYHKGEGQYVSDWALFGHMVWQARAALTTQPAIQVNPEPVAHLKVEVLGRITKVDIEWPNGLHTTLPTGKYPLYIVRGAEHE